MTLHILHSTVAFPTYRKSKFYVEPRLIVSSATGNSGTRATYNLYWVKVEANTAAMLELCGSFLQDTNELALLTREDYHPRKWKVSLSTYIVHTYPFLKYAKALLEKY